MYKVQNTALNNYIETNLTKIEQGMFQYLIDGLPETLLTVDKRENTQLIILVITLAKVLGNSRELILNLKNAHNLPKLIENIEKNYLKENNFKLLALKAKDLGYDVDFNKVDKVSTYLNSLKRYFEFIENQYTLIKNRGSNSAFYQTLRYFNNIDNTVGFPKLNIFEQGENDEEAPEGKKTVDPGTLRAYITELPQEYATGEAFDIENDLFVMGQENELYDRIMAIKPAGIYYELIVKAIFYMFTTEDKVVRENGTLIEQSGGFREKIDLEGSTITGSITYVDEITEIKDIKVSFSRSIKDRHTAENNLNLHIIESDGSRTTANHILPLVGPYSKNINFSNEINIEQENLERDLEKVDVTLTAKDIYDYSNKVSYNIKQDIPEIVDEDKIHVEADDRGAVISNTLNRQNIYITNAQYNYKQEGTQSYSFKILNTSPYEVNITSTNLYNKLDYLYNSGIPIKLYINGIERVDISIFNPEPNTYYVISGDIMYIQSTPYSYSFSYGSSQDAPPVEIGDIFWIEYRDFGDTVIPKSIPINKSIGADKEHNIFIHNTSSSDWGGTLKVNYTVSREHPTKGLISKNFTKTLYNVTYEPNNL